MCRLDFRVMECSTKDGLLIFLLVFSGVLLAIVLVGLFLFLRKKVGHHSYKETLHAAGRREKSGFLNQFHE